MSSVRNGVQAPMKKEADHCLYVHCFAQQFESVSKELLRKCMEFTKRLNPFESVQETELVVRITSLLSLGHMTRHMLFVR